MPLETATYIDGLNASNPAASDAVSSADDHLRLIKSTIKATFPNITGPVTATQAVLNGVSPALTGTPTAPTASAGTNTTQIATTAFVTAADVAERTATATLTNKTLTSPTVNGGTITGITDLAVADGGTGASTFTANSVLLGNGTSAFQTVAPGANGNVLSSNGTTWQSVAPTTPAALSTASGSAPSYSARAWVNFNGTGTPAIRSSGNVSSITDDGAGLFTINFTTALSDTNYSPVMCWRRNNGSSGENNVNGGVSVRGNATYSTAFTTTTLQIVSGPVSNESLTDYDFYSVAIFR